jgi:hypothetical protein
MLSDMQRSTLQMLMGGIDVWSGATLRKGSLRLTVHPSANSIAPIPGLTAKWKLLY